MRAKPIVVATLTPRKDQTNQFHDRRWVWRALAGLAVTMSVVACSQQSVPTSPATSGLNSETVHAHVGHGGGAPPTSPNVASQLAAVRAVTAKYHDIAAAMADGYQ